MSIQAALEHRRAIRQYDETRPLDSECVKHCLELATLAPTSSNMQLWEAYHVTDPTSGRRLSPLPQSLWSSSYVPTMHGDGQRPT